MVAIHWLTALRLSLELVRVRWTIKTIDFISHAHSILSRGGGGCGGAHRQ